MYRHVPTANATTRRINPTNKNGMPTEAVTMTRARPVPTRLKITPNRPSTSATIPQPSVSKSLHVYLPEIRRGAGGGDVISSIDVGEAAFSLVI
jgi:hypothetical protein